jgi:hypothetical protein
VQRLPQELDARIKRAHGNLTPAGATLRDFRGFEPPPIRDAGQYASYC